MLIRDCLAQNAVSPIERVTGLCNVVDGQGVCAATAARGELGNPSVGGAGRLILSRDPSARPTRLSFDLTYKPRPYGRAVKSRG
jgi:hypothetical protein